MTVRNKWLCRSQTQITEKGFAAGSALVFVIRTKNQVFTRRKCLKADALIKDKLMNLKAVEATLSVWYVSSSAETSLYQSFRLWNKDRSQKIPGRGKIHVNTQQLFCSCAVRHLKCFGRGSDFNNFWNIWFWLEGSLGDPISSMTCVSEQCLLLSRCSQAEHWADPQPQHQSSECRPVRVCEHLWWSQSTCWWVWAGVSLLRQHWNTRYYSSLALAHFQT